MARYTALLLVALQLVCIASGSKVVHQSSNILASKLYREISRDNSPENVVFSPISVNYILSGLSFGANEETRKNIVDAIGLPSDENEVETAFKDFNAVLENDKHVSMASRIYHDRSFQVRADFIRKMSAAFNVSVKGIDFQHASGEATNTINKWIEEKTNNTIRNFFKKDDLNADTIAVDINAIHFQSNWKHLFQRNDTKRQTFYGLGGDYETDMMRVEENFNYAFDHALNTHLVELKYEGDYSMILVVPKEKHGIFEIDNVLQTQLATELAGSELPSSPFSHVMRPQKVDLTLPKFQDTFEIDLNHTLEQLGLGSIFLPNSFPRLSNRSDFVISQIKQKAIISVDEFGTEAAAVTVADGSKATPEQAMKVEADHPFVYAIRHDPSDTLLFVGRHVK